MFLIKYSIFVAFFFGGGGIKQSTLLKNVQFICVLKRAEFRACRPSSEESEKLTFDDVLTLVTGGLLASRPNEEQKSKLSVFGE